MKQLAFLTLSIAVALSTARADFGASAQTQASSLQAIPAELVVLAPPTPVLAEGRRHYLYELHVTNFGRSDLSLARLEVLDDRAAVVASYEGDALADSMVRPGAQGGVAPNIGPGLQAIIFIDASTSSDAVILRRLSHQLVFTAVGLEGGAEQTILQGASVSVRTTTPVVLRPPLRGAGWVALNALSNASSHRRTLLVLEGRAKIAQRFAVDFTRIGADGLVFRGDPSVNANWSPYGADVLAVTGGRVVALRDGLPENDPTSDVKAIPISVDTATGNHLVLDIGEGRYALYAHLKPGAFRVRLGERVHVGQVLAALGNSGKSDAPHLHFQIMDGPAPLASEGLPFVFQAFEIAGHVASLSVLADGTGWRTAEPVLRVRQEMPVLNAVIAFPR